jgi:hypothetical protein
MARAGLGWGDKFSPENQRKLAREIMRGQGSRAWEGFKSHPHERRIAEEAFRSGGTPNVAARAQGGPVSRGQPYVVGEHGPELFIPAKSGNISKLPKAVQRAIRPYQGLLKDMPKGDYVGGGTLPWDIPSVKNDIIPDETAERIMQGWLKKYGKMTGHAWTQKSLEDLQSEGFHQNFQGRDSPGPNPSPKLQNINFIERLKNINLRSADQTVTGSGSLKIALENFPRGTRTTTKLAGMFKDINVDRGHAAPWAAG